MISVLTWGKKSSKISLTTFSLEKITLKFQSTLLCCFPSVSCMQVKASQVVPLENLPVSPETFLHCPDSQTADTVTTWTLR